MSYQTIAEAIASQLESITALHTIAYPIANPTTPCAIVAPGATAYDSGMRRGSGGELAFTVRVLLGRSDEKDAAFALYGYVDPDAVTSIKAALDADRTLGGTCDDSWCSGHQEPSWFTYANTLLLGVDFNVVVSIS